MTRTVEQIAEDLASRRENYGFDNYVALIQGELEAERERCARIVWQEMKDKDVALAAFVAAAIRRGELPSAAGTLADPPLQETPEGLCTKCSATQYCAEHEGPSSAVADPLRASSWQPIETAPKDGTVVLVAMITDGKVQRVSDARFQKIGWFTRNGGESCHWRTHWMPLPDPPALLAALPSSKEKV